jgi:hypothetical protein
LTRLEAELKRLEAEYNMFFSGRLPKPPWETRTRVEGLVKRYDRAYIQNTGDRFRFSTLQSRFAAFVDLWDRGMRARRGVRPFTHKPITKELQKGPEDRSARRRVQGSRAGDRQAHGAAESLGEARRAVGEVNVPFHKFAELVKGQVSKLRQTDNAEVAFRVAVKDGKVSFTARSMKGAGD